MAKNRKVMVEEKRLEGRLCLGQKGMNHHQLP
jgi:hypothetical protein